MFNKCIIVLILLHLSACGFRSVHGEASDNISLQHVQLKTSDIGLYQSKTDYAFRKAMEKIISTSANVPKKYVLDIKLDTGSIAYGTQQNSVSTRLVSTLGATYHIRDVYTDAILKSGRHKVMDAYDISVSPYASVVSEESNYEQLAVVLANELSFKIRDELMTMERR